MFIANAFFLIYTIVIVPVQICLWNYDDPCNKFPTLYFDIIVDTFFMVPPPHARGPSRSSGSAPQRLGSAPRIA